MLETLRQVVLRQAMHLCSETESSHGKEQSEVTLSTTESEYFALCEGTKEAIWLRDLLSDVGFEQMKATKILCDNLNTVKWVKDPQHHHRVKHINKKLHFVREKHLESLIEVEHEVELTIN